MIKKLLLAIQSKTTDPQLVNRLIVTLFVKTNKLKVKNRSFISSYILELTKKNQQEIGFYEELRQLYSNSSSPLGIEELIELFEFVISPANKVINGAVYTPRSIREFIVQSSINSVIENGENISGATFGDISCGCGGFLCSIAIALRELTGNKYSKIFSQQIFGLDIEDYSSERTKILLSLLALLEGESITEKHFNIYTGDALDFNWFKLVKKIAKNNGFSAIVGNPPYVISKNINPKVKENLARWEVTKSGRPDLYIPFFEIGLTYLRPKGFLGLITMNTFLRSLNGRAVREYFVRNEFAFKIIDFGWHQIFRKRLTYTCICLLEKRKSEFVYYKQVLPEAIQDHSIYDQTPFSKTFYHDLKENSIWHFDGREFISVVESVGNSLGQTFEIRNGFATLSNEIYLFTPIDEDKEYFFFLKDKQLHKVEKSICRDAIKPNILQSEEDIERLKEKIIFPYQQLETKKTDKGQQELFEHSLLRKRLEVIPEQSLKGDFPLTYQYLRQYRGLLAKRDKGKAIDYPEWYSYGRLQALTHYGYKLLFPYLANKPRFIFCDIKDLLFYNGFAVFSDNKHQLLALQKILNSSLFQQYVSLVSKPYSSNYYSLGKRYIKNFGIPILNEALVKELMSCDSKDSIELLLTNIYFNGNRELLNS